MARLRPALLIVLAGCGRSEVNAVSCPIGYTGGLCDQARAGGDSQPGGTSDDGLPAGVPGPCNTQLAGTATIFCETFDAPATNAHPGRTGDLDSNVWGVSRVSGDGINTGQNEYNLWNPTLLDMCDGTTPRVNAPNDIVICNGQLREASNDNNSGVFGAGTVTVLAMSPKQPFDFANRTGTVSFDVSDDTNTHGAWPELWMSDLPVPAPFNHFDSWEALPNNGFGVRFEAAASVGDSGICQNANNLDKVRWTVGSVAVVRGYVLEDTLGYGAQTMTLEQTDCVIASSGPGDMNHIELRISQEQIDIYATDAGVTATPDSLRLIAQVTNANLTLTRGLIAIEDVHDNGDSRGDGSRPSQREHTFAWDNLAFDGPFTSRDFTYDAPDNTAPGNNGAYNLGQFSAASSATTWQIEGLPTNPNASAARVLFNFSTSGGANPTILGVVVNAQTHTVPWPYPDTAISSARTLAIDIPVTDLIAGSNTVQLGSDVDLVYFDVDIDLVDVANGVPVLPGAERGYPN